MQDKSIKELVAIYNDAAKKLNLPSVKKFSTKDIALRRTKALLAQLGQKSQGEKRGRKAQGLTFPMPFRGSEHVVRATTLRGKFVEAMKAGATLAELGKIAEAHYKLKEKRAPEGIVESTIRILHSYNGYGFKQTGEKIRVVVE